MYHSGLAFIKVRPHFTPQCCGLLNATEKKKSFISLFQYDIFVAIITYPLSLLFEVLTTKRYMIIRTPKTLDLLAFKEFLEPDFLPKHNSFCEKAKWTWTFKLLEFLTFIKYFFYELMISFFCKKYRISKLPTFMLCNKA